MKIGKNKFEKFIGSVGKKITEFKPSEILHNTPNATDEEVLEKKIICPYCLEEIDLTKVLFRMDDNSELAKDNTEIFEDAEFLKLWHDIKKWPQNTQEIIEFDWGYGEVSPGYKSQDNFRYLKDAAKKRILQEREIQAKTITDGIPTQATDIAGCVSDKRLCPKCHCILPNGYGTRRTIFIAVVGIKGAGKTVFLSQLFKESSNRLALAGVGVPEHPSLRLFSECKKIEAGSLLPIGTSTERSPVPVFMTMNVFKDSENVDCVFFDIAGENCDESDDFKNLGKNVKFADGIIMLISPEQLPGAIVKNRKKNVDVSTVISAMAGGIEQTDGRKMKNRSKVKLAITVSMSDLLLTTEFETGKKFAADSIIWQDIEYNKFVRGFMREESKKVAREIRDVIGETLPDTVNRYYETANYFAVSSLGSKPTEDGIEKAYAPENCRCVRIEEPLLWIFSELGIVNKTTKLRWTYNGEIVE